MRGDITRGSNAMTVTEPTPTRERSADALVDRLFTAGVGMMEVISVYIGDRLKLYRSLRDGGPATASELATRAGIAERYAREWLAHPTGAGVLPVEDGAKGAEQRAGFP